MTYQAPQSVIEVISQLDFTEALAADDPRYVQTQEARGSQNTLRRLARNFGLNIEKNRLTPPQQMHMLFFGHVGSGKTTELRHYARELHGPERLFVVEVNIANHLDRNDLQYAETLILMARTLLERLAKDGVGINDARLEPLKKWFDERVLIDDSTREFLLETKAGVENKLPVVPYLLNLFARVTTAFKINTTHKEQLRSVIRNTFVQLADLFNALLRDAENQLREHGLGQRILFIIDGTDKLRGEDTIKFFVHDVEQLLAIRTLALYTAPLSLKYEGSGVLRLNADVMLPMIKPEERDGTPCEVGLAALRDILLHRADRALFASEAEISSLAESSGGHPRELLRLLKLCCEFADDDLIDAKTVDLAIRQLASEYRRFLEPDDYKLLQQMDTSNVHAGNDDRTRKLLYNLALIEYNDGSWRRCHPVVRTLEGYQAAAKAAREQQLNGRAAGA